MANAVVGDYGDLIKIDTGQDLTGKVNLKVFITKPDGTVLTKLAADGVTFGDPDTDHMNYRIQSGLLDIDGEYKFSAYFEDNAGADAGFYSQATPTIYDVQRRNQTP